LTYKNPILSLIKRGHYYEGDRWTMRNPDGTYDAIPFKEIRATTPIDIEKIVQRGPEALIESGKKIATQVREQQDKLFFDTVNETLTKTGRVHDAGGEPFNFDLFLNLLEKVDFDFRDDGKPILPTIFVDPQLGEVIMKQLPEWEKNEDYNKRFNDLIENKKKKWYDRESNRKLVD
jgi:hypothetical protein